MSKKISVSCGKELDIAHVTHLKERFSEAFDKAPSTLNVKADSVERVDSAGLQLLLAAKKQCGILGCDFVLSKASESIVSMAKVLGINNKLGLE